MFNQLILMGRLTRDVELRQSQSGTTLAKFGLAVETYAGKDRKRVLFIDCTAFNKTAETIAKHFAKGSPVLVEGELTLNSWTDRETNKPRSKHEMIVNRFTFLPRNDGGAATDSGEQEEPAPKSGGNDKDYGDVPF